MTRALFTVFVKEFRENLRERRTLFAALIFGPFFGPILFALALSLNIERGTAQSELPVKLAVSHPERAPNLMAFLHEYGVNVEPVSYDDAAARAAIRDHRKNLVLLVGAQFGQQLQAGTPASLALYADSSDLSDTRSPARVRMLLEQYGALIARLRVTARGIDPLILSPIALHDLDVSTPASRSVMALGMLSYLLLFTMLVGGMYLAIDTTAGERERGSLEPLLTVPVRRQEILYGKILATCAYMTLSLTLSVIAFSIVLRFVGLEQFGMSVNFTPLVVLRLVLYCLPLVPVGAALMTIVAAFTRSYREAQSYIGFVLVIPTVPVAFASLLGLRPTATYMAVPSLSQHFLVTSVLREEPLSTLYVTISVAVTLAIGAVLTFIAGRLYDREALLG